MATFDAHRKLTGALGDEGAEAVAQYHDESTRELATRTDLLELRADLYRALWVQGGIIVTTISAVVGASAAVVVAFG